MASNVGGFGGVFQELISPTKSPEPYVAPYVNPQEAQKRTAEGNLAILPTLEDIASGVDSFNLRQRNKNLTESIPGYTNLVADASGTIGSWLRGEIPQDVAGQISRSAAAKSLAGGFGGSGMAGALEARDLGLTSLDLKSKGVATAPGFLQTMANVTLPNPFDVTSGFLTPAQDIMAEQWNEQERATQQWLANRLDALPDPLMAALGQAVGENFNQDTAMVKSYFTGGLSGFGGGGGSSAPNANSVFGGSGSGGGDFFGMS